MNSWLPQTLFRRLVLVWLCSLFILKGITFLTVNDWGDQILFRHMANTEARLLSLYVHVLTRQLPKIAVENNTTLDLDPELWVSLTDTKPRLEVGSVELSEMLQTHILPFLEKGHVPYGQVLSSVQVLADNDRVDQSSLWGMRLPTFSQKRWVRAEIAVHLRNGLWMHLQHNIPLLTNTFLSFQILRLGVELAIMLLVTLLVVFWVVRPLESLSLAAEKMGREPAFTPLPTDCGPREAREAAAAFNRMQQRLKNHIEERGHILGAVSHDLRTPLTRLRLRLEQVESEPVREKLIHDVDMLRNTLDTTISLVRSLNTTAPKEQIPVMPLLRELITARREVGQPVTLHGCEEVTLLLTPPTLASCLENLMDNALRYGGGDEVDVLVHKEKGCLCVDVLDKGPGVPENRLEEVFEAYCRLEPSRNTGTGGYGLGLAIARNLARQNGGDIILSNREHGGLQARLWFFLPKE